MTQNPKLYCINNTHRELKEIQTVKGRIEYIINFACAKKLLKEKFNEANLRTVTRDEIVYHLYLFNTKEQDSDWKEFFPPTLTEHYNFTVQKVSLVLFIETEHFIYCIIGGNAYKIIVPFIDHSFGLNTYARLMNEKEDELASIKTRGITGARAGMNEQFRDSYKLIDFIKFGKVPQEIHVKLSKGVSKENFGFLQSNEADRLNIHVGKAFKIKKSVEFNELHKLIQEMSFVMEIPANEYLSSFKEVTSSNLIEHFFKPELMKRIFDDYSYIGKVKKDTDNRFQFDFCNPNNIQEFYEADEYHLKSKTEKGGYTTFAVVDNRSSIYEATLKIAKQRENVERFDLQVFLQGVRVTCYKDEKVGIGSMFLFHISTEFPIEGKPIFLVDNKWYSLRESFVEDLIYHTKHILGTYNLKGNILDKPWDKSIKREEQDYNMLYNEENNYIVLDRIIADGLELCDVLYYTANRIYLIHVKYGFGSKMRELTNQILISAKRLREEMGKEDKTLLKIIHAKAKAKNRNVNNLSLEEFVLLFDKSITYVLAYSSHLTVDYEVAKNVERFKSNIARYSLVNCSGEMRANFYDLETKQIMRK